MAWERNVRRAATHLASMSRLTNRSRTSRRHGWRLIDENSSHSWGVPQGEGKAARSSWSRASSSGSGRDAHCGSTKIVWR